jgi:hypothetical protein
VSPVSPIDHAAELADAVEARRTSQRALERAVRGRRDVHAAAGRLLDTVQRVVDREVAPLRADVDELRAELAQDGES